MSKENEEEVILVVGGNSYTTKLIRLLDSLATVELIHLGAESDNQGNHVGGLICVRNTQMFPLNDNLVAESIPPIKFELSRYPDEFPDFYYPSKKDNRERNKSWKESLRRANQKNNTRGRGR